MGRMIRLLDFMSAEQTLKTNRDANLRLFDAAGKNVDGLKVSIRATNSGSLVNNRVYKGVHMLDAVETWMKPYPRPILIHHADGGMFGPPAEDPKGRIQKAEFTQLRKGKAFENDYKRPEVGGMGSGFITVEALITDPDAISKVLDGRYLTVSSSQTTNSMNCSICGQDWFEDYCDHQPGKTYNIEVGKGERKETREYLCYGVAGPLVYRELSFVNVPAQPNAQVLGILQADAKDGLQMMTWSNDNAISQMALCDAEGHVITDLTDKEVLEMADPAKKVLVEMPGVTDADLEEEKAEATNDTDKDLDTAATPESNDSEAKEDEGETANSDADKASEEEQNSEVVAMSADEFALANVAKSIKDNGLWLSKDEQVPVFDGETQAAKIGDSDHSHLVICQKTEYGHLIGRTFSTIGDVEEHEHVVYLSENESPATRGADQGVDHTHAIDWASFVDEDVDDVAIEILVSDLEKAVVDENDAKLTAQQRKNLKASTFCGPNRSFPVPDCEHVTAARRLIGRYKGDASTKARIRSCVERKAKKLGCGAKTTKKESADAALKAQGEVLQTLRDEALEEIMLDLATQKSTVRTLQATVTEKSQEIQALEDDLAREKAARSTALANTLVIVRMILGKPDCASVDSHDKFEEKVKSFAGRTPESLWDAVSDLLPEVDLAIRNIRKAKGNDRIVAPADDKVKKPLMRKDDAQHGERKPTRGAKKPHGADQLAKDLES